MSQRPRPEAKHYPSCAIAFRRKPTCPCRIASRSGGTMSTPQIAPIATASSRDPKQLAAHLQIGARQQRRPGV